MARETAAIGPITAPAIQALFDLSDDGMKLGIFVEEEISDVEEAVGDIV